MNDGSTSGFLIDSFEGVNDRFTSLDVLETHGHNVLARAKRFGRWYMLKGLAPEESQQMAYHEMLVKEFDIMMRLQHPGIAQAVSLEDVEGMGKCIVMEWVEGVTLAEWLEGEHTREERRQVAQQLMDALSHIHKNGVVHRDIKPSNIMITSNGEQVKIIDFGLADTDVHAQLKQPAGTHSYMAPEQVSMSCPDARNDIYSLGVVLQEMNLGGLFKKPIARCLMPIAKRYQSVNEMKTDLQHRAAHHRTMRTGLAALGIAAALAATTFITNHFSKKDAPVYVHDNKTRRQVDTLRNVLNNTATQLEKSQLRQDSLRNQLGNMNDTITSLHQANSQLRMAEMERNARQKMVEDAIAEGIRLIDATNHATHLNEHIDTVSSRRYLWIDWQYLALQGEKKVPEYMNSIRNRFSEKELAEIEQSLKQYCNNYMNKIKNRLDKEKRLLNMDFL